ncbi:MAG TPA: hypothetical protein VNV18_03670 [Stellaceae bacterium]|jgi:hypothetical protein|nr:hypothetical protein [Stellaceae bacterium]
MAKGMPGADSSNPVTTEIGGRNLVDLATALFGRTPVVWGRYFTSAVTTGTIEYRHLEENQLLRANGVRVLPIARQTLRVNGSAADGNADAKANVEDLILTFGTDYLAEQGGQFLMFLDVEGAPSLSAAYYEGWANELTARSQSFSGGRVTVLPCVYATFADHATWQAVAASTAAGVAFHGAWIARWLTTGCKDFSVPALDFDDRTVRPTSLPAAFEILLWQYSNNCHGGAGFDCTQTNPAIDLEQDLLGKCVLPPPAPIA